MPLSIVRDDITKLQVDAIVNPSNTNLQISGGVCCAIFKKAGIKELQSACNKIAPINVCDAVVTSGFNLPAKYIIHTASPFIFSGTNVVNGSFRLGSFKQEVRIMHDRKNANIFVFKMIFSIANNSLMIENDEDKSNLYILRLIKPNVFLRYWEHILLKHKNVRID